MNLSHQSMLDSNSRAASGMDNNTARSPLASVGDIAGRDSIGLWKMGVMSASMLDASTTVDIPPPPYCLTESVHGQYNLRGSVKQSRSQTTRKDSLDCVGRRTLSAKDWEKQKQNIHDLYIVRDLPIGEVKTEMKKNFDFNATLRMYKSRLSSWRFNKNVTEKDWQAAALMMNHREKAGKVTVAFKIRGRRKTKRELDQHIKAHHISEKEFIANARAQGVTHSSTIRCVSPGPESSETPLSSESTSTGTWSIVVASISSGYSIVGSNPQPHDNTRSSKSVKDSHVPRARESRDAVQPVSTAPSWTAEVLDLMHDMLSPDRAADSSASTCRLQENVHCDHVQQDLGLMLIQSFTPEAMSAYPEVRDISSWGLISHPDPEAEEIYCPKCGSPRRYHSPVPPDWLLDSASVLPQGLAYQTLDPSMVINPDNDHASEFQACCYACCIYRGQGKHELLAKSLQRANQIFEEMLIEGNSMTLLSVLLAVIILHAHDQGAMAELIVRSAYLVSCHTIGEDNSVSRVLEWATAFSGRRLAQSRVETVHLRAIFTDHQKHFGHSHPHTIASLYFLAFSLAIDMKYAEAETEFAQLSEICSQALGKRHLQTLSALNGLSRVQYRQGKHELAAVTLRRSIDSHPLGVNHPHRLESMRRLALIYKRIDQKELAEQIYWNVLRGRIKTLGRTHRETESARAQLERLLKEMNKGDDEGATARKVQKLFDDERTVVASEFEIIEPF